MVLHREYDVLEAVARGDVGPDRRVERHGVVRLREGYVLPLEIVAGGPVDERARPRRLLVHKRPRLVAPRLRIYAAVDHERQLEVAELGELRADFRLLRLDVRLGHVAVGSVDDCVDGHLVRRLGAVAGAGGHGDCKAQRRH